MVTNAAAIIPALLNMTKRLPVREVGTPLITSMTPRWTEFLRSNGATIHGTCVMTFGDGNRELLAARNGAILAPLSKFGLLSITGEDAAAFLHSQLSSDVNALLVSQAQYASYCSAKGRVLANFLLWREPAGYSALLSRDLLESMRKRLAMFVLRSKVKIEDASEQRVVLGISAGHKAVEHCWGPVQHEALAVSITEAGAIVSLGEGRYIATVETAGAEAAWTQLAADLTPAGEPAWNWLDVRAGIPWVSAATQDQFIPQMANLDLIGAVNFRKGCYPGQEIVARTQYLGKLKRRMFRFHVESDAIPVVGSDLFSATISGQSCGNVINSAAAPDGGFDLLAVTQIEAAHASILHLGSIDGPAMNMLDLPYQVPQAA